MSRKITHLVVHHNGVDGRTVADIIRTHLGNGWAGIGYHRVVEEDATTSPGRAEHKPGAHTSDFNKHTLAVCVIGNLNRHRMTNSQWNTLIKNLVEWCRIHELDPFTAILGHRETGPFVRPAFRTKKNCPGKFVNMDSVRRAVADAMGKEIA